MKIKKIRHSLAHILALAVKELYPGVKFGMGPDIENGFYYDFEFKKPISSSDLPEIEKKMKELLQEEIKFEKKVVSKEEAEKIFKDQPYKLDLLKDLGKEVSLYSSDGFTDLCRGPHMKSTLNIPLEGFTLDRIAGAYWKGDEKNSMLTRIYGLAFADKKELQNFLEKRKEAKRRDHRLLGKRLDLFIFDEEVGQGLPLYLPKGAMVRHLLMDFALKTYLKEGYELVSTPHIGKEDLWEHSGHLKFYKEDMYGPLTVDEEKYRLKPMNCPFHVKMYKNEVRSYRDLPLRWAEMGTVYRYEKSGELHGLTRPRAFTQDDAHIICTPEQLEKEVISALKLTRYIYQTLGLQNLKFKLSIRQPGKEDEYFGSEDEWRKGEQALKKALEKFGQENYELDEGGAAFYAPKIDVDAVDAVGRRWQLSTIQIDFNLPKKFDMKYVDKKGKEKTPFMIHRALLGSLERFLGVYIEHTAGEFPLWLAPEQVWIIPVADRNKKYAEEVAETISTLRIKIKGRGETVSKKIREGELQKIPYLLVVGDKEEEKKEVSVRKRNKGDLGTKKLKDFAKQVKKEIEQKTFDF